MDKTFCRSCRDGYEPWQKPLGIGLGWGQEEVWPGCSCTLDSSQKLQGTQAPGKELGLLAAQVPPLYCVPGCVPA